MWEVLSPLLRLFLTLILIHIIVKLFIKDSGSKFLSPLYFLQVSLVLLGILYGDDLWKLFVRTDFFKHFWRFRPFCCVVFDTKCLFAAALSFIRFALGLPHPSVLIIIKLILQNQTCFWEIMKDWRAGYSFPILYQKSLYGNRHQYKRGWVFRDARPIPLGLSSSLSSNKRDRLSWYYRSEWMVRHSWPPGIMNCWKLMLFCRLCLCGSKTSRTACQEDCGFAPKSRLSKSPDAHSSDRLPCHLSFHDAPRKPNLLVLN